VNSHLPFYQVAATAIPTLMIAVAIQREGVLSPAPERTGRVSVFHRVSHAVLILAGAVMVVSGEWQALLTLYRGHDVAGAAKAVDLAIALLFGAMLVPSLRPSAVAVGEELPPKAAAAISLLGLIMLVVAAAISQVMLWSS
jgi:hypothetical protein